jgi:hypothetical protein
MKTFAQFIKETYHIQEKLDATVYGQVRYGAPPVRPKSKSEISNMVSKGIDDYKSGKPVQPPGKSTARKRKLSFSGYASLSYEKKSGGGKTPPPTKVRPDKTTDPKGTKVKPDKPKNTNKFGGKTIKTTTKIKTVKAIKGNGGRPNKTSNDVRPIKTSTPPPSTSSSSTNVLTKGSNTSSPSPSPSPSPSSTKVLTKKPTPPPTPVRPVRGV